VKKQTINRLIQAVVVLAVVYALVSFSQGRQTDTGIAMPANLTGLRTASDKLVIETETDTVELEREGEKWFWDKKAIKKAKATEILDALEGLEFARVVSSDGSGADQYGLIGGATKSISVYEGKKRLRTIVIGGATNPGRFYAKLGGKSVIYEAEGGLLAVLEEPFSQWTETEKKAPAKTEKEETEN